MEFRYNINNIFKNTISKINYTLLPSDFSGDRRNAQACASQVADIIDVMGLASAKAQDLQNPVTSAEKMRNLDHLLYIMIDPIDNNNKGSVIGLLKVGMKNLFLFDETGMVHERQSLCILDFYIHESKQRTGFGKKLYDYMLCDKNITPCKLAIDKPSVKFLSFLYKHYGLEKIYPQTNNFVLFEGFFEEKSDTSETVESTSHPPTSHHGTRDGYDNHSVSLQSSVYTPTLYGRHTAFKPNDTMGKIIGQDLSRSDPSSLSSGV